MSKFLFGDEPPQRKCGEPCFVPLEDIWERHPLNPCCPEKKKCCPPKTKARDTIRLSREEAQRCFNYGKRSCDGAVTQSVINRYYKMEIREKGYCDVLMCIPPSEALMDGSVCWAWSEAFLSLPEGYYEADVYIDGCICHTHCFYLPKCSVQATPTEVKYKNGCDTCHTCGSVGFGSCSCNNDCCSAIPMVDNEIIEPKAVGCPEGCDEC